MTLLCSHTQYHCSRTNAVIYVPELSLSREKSCMHSLSRLTLRSGDPHSNLFPDIVEFPQQCRLRRVLSTLRSAESSWNEWILSSRDVVLCEETLGTSDKKSTGNFAQITQSLLTKFPPQAKHNFHYDRYFGVGVDRS